MTTVAEKYLQIAKLAKDPANAEVVIDGILTFFGLDYFDLDLGVEYLYTTKVIDYKFRSVLHKAEDMDAIMAWFKEKAGVTDEEIAAAEAKEKEYAPTDEAIVNGLKQAQAKLQDKKQKAVTAQSYEMASTLRDREKEILKKLDDLTENDEKHSR